MTIQQSGERVLSLISKRWPGAQAEAFVTEQESRSSDWSEGLPENQDIKRSQGVGVRMIIDRRLGFAHSNLLNDSALEAMVERAAAGARFTTQDEWLKVPAEVADRKITDLELVDPALTETSWPERSAFLDSIEKTVRQRDRRLSKVLRATYREGCVTAGVQNSRGVSQYYDGTHVSFSVACVALDGGETQIGYGFQAARHFADLKRSWVIDKAVENTLALLGGRQVVSGRYDLVLDPLVAAEMLELFAVALRADQVQKGKSFLGQKQDQRVASDAIELVDDGGLLRGLGSAPVDTEGTPTQRTLLIKNGILRSFLYDSYTADKSGQKSTGNAGRGSYKGLPEPEASNFFLAPGAKSPEALLAGVDTGLYVRNVMGLHTVDTISGDYSLGISGQRIEQGRLTHAVRGVTIAGNLLDLFQNIAAVGSDLTFTGSVGSPTLHIAGVSVGGA